MAYDPQQGADYVVNDPPFLDPEFPSEHFVTHFKSQASVVHALVWIAGGRDTKGCVIISPQAFGGDRMESLIIPLLSSGISVITFQPRGMWDGQHTYSLISALDDLRAAVAFVRTADSAGKKTKAGKSYRIDPERIAVLGVSGAGGTVSFGACTELDDLRFGVAIAPANHELYRDMSVADIPKEMFEFVRTETAGRVDVYSRLQTMTKAEIDRLSIIHNVPRLLSKTLLLIGATHDIVTPVADCHLPIARAFREAGAQNFTEVMLEGDHLLLGRRIALAQVVISWLRSECGF